MEEGKMYKGLKKDQCYLSQFRYDVDSGVYFPPEQEGYAINYSDGIRVENYILKAIKGSKDVTDNSEELMRSVRDWPSYYHLATGRSNILRALDLPADSEILELGSGCGALTRYLGENFELVDGIEGSPLRAQIARERCRDLENVRLFCSDFQHANFDFQYDVVTLIGVLEYAPMYSLNHKGQNESCLSILELAKGALKENGTLIVAIENKIGIKYWSGCPEDHTGKVFEGIHGYPSKRGTVTFSKKELQTTLKTAGFSNSFFYYCFPDYKFASTIISEIDGNERDFYLHNWIQVPFPANGHPRDYTFHEGLVLKTLSSGGLLKEFANSFLVVAAGRASHMIGQPNWIAKRFSLKRRKEFQCITTLIVNPETHIEKRSLSQSSEGYTLLRTRKREIGINHVTIEFCPWYAGDLMVFGAFEAAFGSDFQGKILEMLKGYHSELLNRYYTGVNDEAGFPLLRGESVDFILRNIIAQREGALVHIDDEWHFEDYIAVDYVMYRCIRIDIIESQYPWIRSEVRNTDKFTMRLIKSFYPSYGKRRHDRNRLLEESFQKAVSGEHNQIILRRRPQFLRKMAGWNLSKEMWYRSPERVRSILARVLGLPSR